MGYPRRIPPCMPALWSRRRRRNGGNPIGVTGAPAGKPLARSAAQHDLATAHEIVNLPHRRMCRASRRTHCRGRGRRWLRGRLRARLCLRLRLHRRRRGHHGRRHAGCGIGRRRNGTARRGRCRRDAWRGCGAGHCIHRPTRGRCSWRWGRCRRLQFALRLGHHTACRLRTTDWPTIRSDPLHPCNLPTMTGAHENTAAAIDVLLPCKPGRRRFGRPAGPPLRHGGFISTHGRQQGDRNQLPNHHYPHVASPNHAGGLFPSKARKYAILCRTCGLPHPLVPAQYIHGRSDGCPQPL